MTTGMDLTQIESALARLFDDEQHRIVFWNDPEGEFADALAELALDGVQVLRLDELCELEVKIRLERDDPQGRYLLYAPTEEPELADDWLLDIRLYSHSFRADRASILLDQLGLTRQHLRPHLAERRKFFDSKERLRKLQQMVESGDSEVGLDRKMLAVIVKADQPQLFNILQTLYHEMAQGEEVDLQTVPEAWGQIEKFDLAEPFWRMVRSAFGYEENSPSLRNLLIRLMLTDFAHHLEAAVPESLHHLLLPIAGRSNAVVCLAQWRDSASRSASYDRLSERVAETVRLDEHLAGLEVDALLNVMTFQTVEKAIIRQLRDQIQETADTVDPEWVHRVANRRQAGHWANLGGAIQSEVPRQALHAVYQALVAAAELFELRNRHRDGFDYDSPEAMYRAYEQTLYRFDQLYRHFSERADLSKSANWDVLKRLRDEVEAVYVNWYLVQLGLAWSRLMAPDEGTGLIERWQIEDVTNQQQFFDRHVQSRLKEADNRKAYVIISDAFRYEAAEELVRELNGRYRMEAELRSHLATLPSYTALGMASLLPHETLNFTDRGEVLVDGRPTASLDQRDAVLAAHGGLAVTAEALLAKKKEDGRALVAEKRMVYIYHNVVDAVGDAASTERDTFPAVTQAIRELADLVRYVVNNLNGNHVLVTADHGFLFSETPPGDTDRSKLEHKPAGTVKAKKRYLLGRDLPAVEGVWRGSTAQTAGAEGGMAFLIPRGTNRFHFSGGARFIHGGAMPQEVVVPLVTVRHRKDKATRSRTAVKPVTVHVLGTNHKITTARHRFELLQVEAVGERVKPVTLKVAVYDGSEPVTSVVTLTFDSASLQMDDRRKSVSLVLQDRPYDKRKTYRLVLRDTETDLEQQHVDVTIDRAFADDF